MALSRACVSRGVVRGPGGGAILLIIIIPAEQAMKNTHDSTSAAAAVARAMVDATRASTEGATERHGGSGVRWTGTRAKFSCQRFRGRAKKNVCGPYDRRKDEHLCTYRRILEGEKKRGMRGPATRSAFWGCRAIVLATRTLLSLKSLCGGGVPFSHPSLGLSVFFPFYCGVSPLAVCLVSLFVSVCRSCVSSSSVLRPPIPRWCPVRA